MKLTAFALRHYVCGGRRKDNAPKISNLCDFPLALYHGARDAVDRGGGLRKGTAAGAAKGGLDECGSGRRRGHPVAGLV